jgi:hypothetical protein
MSEKTEVTGVTEKIVSGTETTETTGIMKPEEIQKQINDGIAAASKAIEERYKTELSGRDKAYTALKKERDELELAGKTDKEKAELLAKKEAEEKQKAVDEFNKTQSNFFKLQNASAGIIPVETVTPNEILEFLSGSTEDEIKQSAAKFKVIADKIYQAGINKALEGTSTTPKKGNQSQNIGLAQLEAQYQKAVDSKDMTAQLRIRRLIDEEKKKAKI